MFQGVYINLDKAVQRRQRMEEQLTLTGLTGKVERFSALTSEGFSNSALTSGQVGCFRSHLRAIKMGSKNSFRLPMVIFEDDVVIPSLFEQSVNAVLTSMQKHPWDIIFLNQVMDLGQYFRIKALLKLKVSMGNIHEPNHSAFQLVPSLEEIEKFYREGIFALTFKGPTAKTFIRSTHELICKLNP